MTDSFLFTSESVTEGHPDKVADQISDAILDANLASDPEARVACETMVGNKLIVLAGEITSQANINLYSTIKVALDRIGYRPEDFGFENGCFEVQSYLHAQSPDIAQGVDEKLSKEQGAGDQGMMFGYACKDTPTLMPAPIYYSHLLAQKLAEYRKTHKNGWLLRPDGKTQVTFEYVNDIPRRIDSIVVSTQHDEAAKNEELNDIVAELIKQNIPEHFVEEGDTKVYVNPTGRFVVGGPVGDSGLTGRKIIVDTYGGMGRHGGGAFSGKDPSKVDRSAAYMARHIAKSIVASNLAEKCEVQLAYVIGRADPASVYVNTFGTSNYSSDEELEDIVRDEFPLKPKELIRYLDLKRPIYSRTAAYGHFGREETDFTWESVKPLGP